MNTSAKGTALEHDIKHLLEANGWSVMRGAASKGEMFEEKVDLIATKITTQGNEKKLLIYGFQCKVNKI